MEAALTQKQHLAVAYWRQNRNLANLEIFEENYILEHENQWSEILQIA